MTVDLPPTDEHPVYVVLLAGGAGTRFWPASRSSHPKQFLKLFGDTSLLRMTFERMRGLAPPERTLVVTGKDYAERTRSEVPEIPASNVLIEPSRRDTAAAIMFAATAAMSHHPDPTLVITPTDHHVEDLTAFRLTLQLAVETAKSGVLVTLGIEPTWPATSYGYIEVESTSTTGVMNVIKFREKPERKQAERFIATGRNYWNSGIFVWTMHTFMREMRTTPSWSGLAPVLAWTPRLGDGRLVELWGRLPTISIDRALMEGASHVALVPLRAGWSDLGTWDAIADLHPSDKDGNGRASDAVFVGARNCSVHRHGQAEEAGTLTTLRPKPRLYALVGVQDLIVVETEDAVLICKRHSGETMRQLVRRLAAAGRPDVL